MTATVNDLIPDCGKPADWRIAVSRIAEGPPSALASAIYLVVAEKIDDHLADCWSRIPDVTDAGIEELRESAIWTLAIHRKGVEAAIEAMLGPHGKGRRGSGPRSWPDCYAICYSACRRLVLDSIGQAFVDRHNQAAAAREGAL